MNPKWEKEHSFYAKLSRRCWIVSANLS